MMALTENLVSGAAMEVLGTTQVEYQGTPIDLTAPWRRVTMSDLVKEAMGGFDFDAPRRGASLAVQTIPAMTPWLCGISATRSSTFSTRKGY